MTINYEFGGMLYRNSRDMHIAIAEEWLSAGGRNTRDEMLADLPGISDSDLADEAIANWDANDMHRPDGEPPQRFDRDELIAAFVDIRANFDHHFPQEEEPQ
jgi:hypothetical protein